MLLAVLTILAFVDRHEGGLLRFVRSRFKDATSIQQLISCKPALSNLSKERTLTVKLEFLFTHFKLFLTELTK
jgi:hypothetical protein